MNPKTAWITTFLFCIAVSCAGIASACFLNTAQLLVAVILAAPEIGC